jgi:hypothetical protein
MSVNSDNTGSIVIPIIETPPPPHPPRLSEQQPLLPPTRTIKEQIHTILENNKLDDLNRFLKKRRCLNTYNSYMVYLFHIVQSSGILTTTIGTGYNITYLIWIGVGLNILASLINIFEKTNNSISVKILKDIIAIQNGTYIDEGIMVDTNDENNIESKK